MPGFRVPIPCDLVSGLDCRSGDGRQTEDPHLQAEPFGVSKTLSFYSNPCLELTPERSGRSSSQDGVRLETFPDVLSILNQPKITIHTLVKPSPSRSRRSIPECMPTSGSSLRPGEPGARSRTLPRTRVQSKYILAKKERFRDEDLVWL